MTTETFEINEFTILIEQANAEKTIIEKCDLGSQVVGFVFFGSGDAEITINYGNKHSSIKKTKGLVISFFGTEDVELIHKISYDKPLRRIAIFTSTDNLEKLTAQENANYPKELLQLLYPQDDFVKGPNFYMTPDMLNAVNKILNSSYTGATKKLFLESQIMELLSHFFGLASKFNEKSTIKPQDREKLNTAKQILLANLETPPSLSELSKQTGLNNYKLKKGFKELFGLPVYKYLQHERLRKAHELLSNKGMSIQEASWFVGYESLSSFSNAFLNKFGYRPSEIKK